jgi:Arc/MetJ family transcription regulator
MTETVVHKGSEPELDEDLLAEAQRGLGTTSQNETLNAVLWEYVVAKRERRLAALNRLRQMSDEGLFNYGALDEADR